MNTGLRIRDACPLQLGRIFFKQKDGSFVILFFSTVIIGFIRPIEFRVLRVCTVTFFLLTLCIIFQRVSDNLELMHAVCVNVIMSKNKKYFAQALFTNVAI